MNTKGSSWEAPRVKARSVAAWPDGNDDVTGPVLWCPAPGGRALPTRGLRITLATTAVVQ